MAFNVNAFQAVLKGDGARPSLFQVTITNPVQSIADIQVPFMAKATTLPPSVLGVVPVRYFGREIKLAGNRTYPEWSVTIINDEDFAIRNALEQWSHAINSPLSNLRTLNNASPLLYKSSAQVVQFSKTGIPLRTYNFVNIWPQDISPIELSWDNADAIEEYSVAWAYDYWTVEGLTGDAGGDGLERLASPTLGPVRSPL